MQIFGNRSRSSYGVRGNTTRRALAVGLVLSMVFSVVAVQPAVAEYDRSGETGQWDIEGDVVYAITRAGDRVFVGGDFDGARRGVRPTQFQANLAAFDAETGDFRPGFRPDVRGVVYTLAPSVDGSVLYVGGDFTSVNGQSRNGLVALDPLTGDTIAEFDADIDAGSAVNDIEVSNEFVYIGGDFSRVNDRATQRLARVRADNGNRDGSWLPNPTGGPVNDMAIAPAGDRLYAAGAFNRAGGLFTGSLAAIDLASGDGIRSFDYLTDTPLRSVDASDDRVIVTYRVENLAQVLDRSGDVLENLVGDGDIQEVEIVGRRAFLGSHSRTFEGRTSTRIHAIRLSDGEADFSFNSEVFGWPGVFAIYASGSELWVGGDFYRLGSTGASKLGRFSIRSGERAPTTPTSVTATGLGDSGIEVSWDRSSADAGISGYRVLRGGVQVAFTSSTSWLDRSTVDGVVYQYHVEAVDQRDSISPRSEGATASSRPDRQPPSTPGTPSLVLATESRLDISWAASTDDVAVASYEVSRDGAVVGATSAADRSFSDRGLSAGASYSYQVRAIDTSGNRSALSPARSLRTLPPDGAAPSAPEALAVIAVSANSVSLSWEPALDDRGVEGYHVFRDGVLVDTVTTTAASDGGLTNGTEYVYRVAAFDGAGNVGPQSNFVIARPVFTGARDFTAIDFGSAWSYLDNGSDQGSAWRESGFDDSSWRNGNGQLGYGDGDERTVVSFGSNSNDKHITTYFRREFTVGDLVTTMRLRLIRDDGVAVHINGQEVVRDNLRSDYNYRTPASDALGSPVENAVLSFAIDPAVLVAGSNVIAVEIHQSSGTSSDISFDLELTGTAPAGDVGVPTTPSGVTAITLDASTIALSWEPSSDNEGVGEYRVYRDGVKAGTVAHPATSFTETALVEGVTYEYVVVAFDLSGNPSAPSEPLAATIGDPVDPGPSVAPDSVIESPVFGDRVATGPLVIRGTASDDVGVERIRVWVRDIDTRLYLQADGSQSLDFTMLEAVLDSPGQPTTTWSLDIEVPEGRFAAVSHAFDADGNRELEGSRVRFNARP